MQLENVSVAIRPRNPWEAMDLGFLMARRWWRPVYGAWFAVVLPLFLVLNAFLYQYPLAVFLILWWLKPLYDRVLLHVYSRAVFGEPPGARETLRALPGLLRTGLLGHLTLMRVDLARSFRLPVLQLEGLQGKPRRTRLRVLQANARGYAVWLTVVCLHFELFIEAGALGLVYLFMPQGSDLDLTKALFESAPGWAALGSNALYLIALSLIEPVYVAAGFALYLNRRTILEGWDIELIFRRLSRRLTALSARAATPFAVAILAGLFAFAAPPVTTALAAEEPVARQRQPATEAPRVIKEVLEDEAFDTHLKREAWVPSWEVNDDEAEPSSFSLRFGAAIASLLELLLWAALAVMVVLAVVYFRRWLPRPEDQPAAKPAQPASVSGLDIRPESLPDDVPGAALDLWRAGDARASLSLLYRAGVSALVDRHALALPESATEGDVLESAQVALAPDTAAFLEQITRTWQALAYAHRRPEDALVTQLCGEWHSHFEGSA